MSDGLHPAVRDLIDAPHFVTLATVNPDGSPHSSPMWLTRDDDELLLSTVVGRQKERNLKHNPWVSITIVDPEDPYRYAEIRGKAELAEDEGRALINRLARKYTGEDYQWDGPDARRVVIRVRPERVTGSAVQ